MSKLSGVALMQPTEAEKAAWSRLAQTAYATMRNHVGTAYSVAASLPRDGQLRLAYFDVLQAGYRAWLVDGTFPQAGAL